MAKRAATDTVSMPVTGGSGNVFAGLGVAEPEGELTKTQLVNHICHAIKRRRLSQLQAPHSLGSTSPRPQPS